MPVTNSSLRALAFVGVLVTGAVVAPSRAGASSPFLVIPDPAIAERTAAYRYANMTNEEALAELDHRKILYLAAGPIPGVRAPVRLTGRLHGVWFHSSLPAEERQHSLFEVLDARLALALDDFAAVLERHDIDEVIHYTMYRPNGGGSDHGVADEPSDVATRGAPPRPLPTALSGRDDRGKKAKAAPRRAPAPRAAHASATHAPLRPGKTAHTTTRGTSRSHGAAKGAEQPASRSLPAPAGTRHPAGLAIDVGALHKRDGRWLSIASHFHGHIGDRTCGAGARTPEEPEGRELRSIVCEASDLGVFTYVLTPNYNAAHVDHYHMEIKPGVRWFLYN